MKYLLLALLAVMFNFSSVTYARSHEKLNLIAQQNTQNEEKTDEQSKQDDDILNQFDYEPSVSTNEETSSFNTIGLGYNFNALFAQNGDFGNYMKNQFGMGELSMPVFLNGFSATLALEPTKKFAIGFNYYAGNKKYSEVITEQDLKGYSKYLRYGISNLNVSVDYAYVPIKRFAILGGLGLGFSYMDLDYSQVKSDYDYTKEFVNNGNDPNTKFFKMNGSFFSIDPHISFQYLLSTNFMIKVSTAYVFPFSPDWKYNNYSTLNNVPKELKPQGFLVSAGLYLGIFDF